MDGLVLPGRAQVLADRHDVDAGRAQVREHGRDLVVRLAEAHHEAALRGLPRDEVLRRPEHLQAETVAALRPQEREETRHRLDVVVEDLGPRLEHRAQGLAVALEVGDEHLDPRPGQRASHGAHGVREVGGAAVGEVVAVDRGQDHVAQAHPRRGLRHARGLRGVRGQGPGGGDGAVGAAARAAVAEEHEGGGAAREALPEVRAARLLAHRVEGLLPQENAQAARPRGKRARLAGPLGQSGRGLRGGHFGYCFMMKGLNLSSRRRSSTVSASARSR